MSLIRSLIVWSLLCSPLVAGCSGWSLERADDVERKQADDESATAVGH